MSSNALHVLEQPLVLNPILQSAGPNQWLFLGSVSKAWVALYNAVHRRPACRQRGLRRTLVRGKTTNLAEAATSLTRVLYACDCDAQLASKKVLPLSKAAAAYGSIDVLGWAKAAAGSKWLAWHQDLCMAAAAGNQLATLQYLCASDPELQWEAVEVATEAAECADLSMLEWILDQQLEWSIDSIERVSEGAARAVDAIDQKQFPADRRELRYCFARASTKCGAVESLRWLEHSGYPFRASYLADTASAAGQLAALRFLVEEAGCPWNAIALRRAAVAADSAEVLQWVSSASRAVCTTAHLSDLLAAACRTEKLRAAAWLQAAGAEWPASILPLGPAHARFAVWPLRTMQWALSNGCPWGLWCCRTCTRICSASRLGLQPQEQQSIQDAMLWAHAAGCPCSSRLHHIGARLVHKMSSCSSDVDSDVDSDAGGDVPPTAVGLLCCSGCSSLMTLHSGER
jgi:hypothetical protein